MAKNNKQSFKDLLRYSMPSGIGLTKKELKAADRYGIDFNSYGYNHPDGRNSANPKRNPQNLDADIAALANNDYDTRRSVEAAALTGKKKAEGFAKRGFSGLEDVTKANNMFRKMHKRHGNGGDFSSQSDYSGLTYSLVQRDRRKLEERLASNEPKQFLNDYIDKNIPTQSTQAEVEIPTAQNNGSAEGDNSINSPITQANPQTVTGDNNVVSQTNAIKKAIDNRIDKSDNSSRMFLDDYKLNLGSKLNLRSFS